MGVTAAPLATGMTVAELMNRELTKLDRIKAGERPEDVDRDEDPATYDSYPGEDPPIPEATALMIHLAVLIRNKEVLYPG